MSPDGTARPLDRRRRASSAVACPGSRSPLPLKRSSRRLRPSPPRWSRRSTWARTFARSPTAREASGSPRRTMTGRSVAASSASIRRRMTCRRRSRSRRSRLGRLVAARWCSPTGPLGGGRPREAGRLRRPRRRSGRGRRHDRRRDERGREDVPARWIRCRGSHVPRRRAVGPRVRRRDRRPRRGGRPGRSRDRRRPRADPTRDELGAYGRRGGWVDSSCSKAGKGRPMPAVTLR